MAIALPPKIHPEISEFLSSEKERVFELIDAFGSPVHLVFPQILEENATAFRSVLKKHGLEKASIYFAIKVNKSETFLESAAAIGIGADVSSLQELRAALGHGITGNKISVSGASKTSKLLLLAIQHGCTISVDSIYELKQLVTIANRIKLESLPCVTIRVNKLDSNYSRFGISLKDLPKVYEELLRRDCPVNFRGFAFHLSGYSIDERVHAIQRLIQELRHARSLGFTCNVINIGGGFTVNYVDKTDWDHFLATKQKDTFVASKDISFFYPYANQRSRELFLDAILSAPAELHKRISESLKEFEIHLTIEPGRSLLDQAGITCLYVKGVKPTSDGTLVVEVDANINHLSEQWFGSEYCVDPIHLRKNEMEAGETIEAAVAGNTCLEMDMLSRRKIEFLNAPQVGDLLIYVNTAGYQMDSNESEFHQIPIPTKIAAFKQNGEWRWKKASEFSLLDTLTSQ